MYRLVLGLNLIRDNIERQRRGEPDLVYPVYGDPGEMTQQAGPRVALLVERVGDAELRALVNDLQLGYGVLFPHSKSEAEAKQVLDTIHNIQLKANKRIGELLRSL